MWAVAQHYLTKRTGGGTGIHRTAKALLIKQRQHAGMINVGVGQQGEIQLCRAYRQGHILEKVLALLHAVIHYALFIAHLNISATAGDLVGRADECYTHSHASRFFLYFTPETASHAIQVTKSFIFV